MGTIENFKVKNWGRESLASDDDPNLYGHFRDGLDGAYGCLSCRGVDFDTVELGLQRYDGTLIPVKFVDRFSDGVVRDIAPSLVLISGNRIKNVWLRFNLDFEALGKVQKL